METNKPAEGPFGKVAPLRVWCASARMWLHLGTARLVGIGLLYGILGIASRRAGAAVSDGDESLFWLMSELEGQEVMDQRSKKRWKIRRGERREAGGVLRVGESKTKIRQVKK